MSRLPERRFIEKIRPVTLAYAIGRWLAGYGWSRTEIVLEEVKPGDKRYANAPIASTTIMLKDTFK